MTTIYDHAPAVVADIRDPEKRGRVKVRCAALYGTDQVIDEWVEPEATWGGASHGAFFLPAVGDVVRLEYSAENSADENNWESFNRNPQFRYSTSSRASEYPKEFTAANYLKRDGFKAIGGAVIAMGRQKNFLGLAADDVRLGKLDATQPAVRGDEYASMIESLIARVDEVIEQVKALALTVAPPPAPPHPSIAALILIQAALATLSPSGTLSAVVKLE